MRVFAVLDLMGGQVVRGIAGRRDQYRPLVSRLVRTSEPFEVARAFRDRFGLSDLYVADLDAIAGAAPALGIFSALQHDGFRLLIDAGLRTPADAEPLVSLGAQGIVAGLETLAGPVALAALLEQCGPAKLVFSLDLRDGQPLLGSLEWGVADAWDIANLAVDLGAQRILVLDLARVGLASGTATEELCGRLKKKWPRIEVLTGGGIRGSSDLDRLKAIGVDGVLMASALHSESLTRKDLRAMREND
jgi:phosphoribosylformimino-5-aminoimidazole carboxamide ribotide isomerase